MDGSDGIDGEDDVAVVGAVNKTISVRHIFFFSNVNILPLFVSLTAAPPGGGEKYEVIVMKRTS